MDVENWLKDPKTIQKSRKKYAHFDHRLDIFKAAEYINDSDKIASHGFYPNLEGKSISLNSRREKYIMLHT